MHLTTLLTLTTAFLGLASATANPDPPSAPETNGLERASGPNNGTIDPSAALHERDAPMVGVYWCTEAKWQGSCEYNRVPMDGSCWNVAPGSIYTKAISSVGPDRGAKCNFYVGPKCYSLNGESMYKDLTYPGYAYLADSKLTLKLDDMIGSFSCRPE